MELRHLRCFVVMAEELHFARAAERLHMEQSPLSRSIKALEDELDVQLFVRTPRGTHITAPGSNLLAQARRILASVDEFKTTARATRAEATTQLRVGLLESFSQPRLPQLLAHSRNHQPDLDILLFELPFHQQIKNLRDGILDIGLAWESQGGEGIRSEPLWADRLVVMLPAAHRLADQSSVTLEDLAGETLLVGKPEVDSGSSRQFAEFFSRIGLAPLRKVEMLTSLGMLVPLVAARYGYSFILAQQAEAVRHADVVVRPVREAPQLQTYALTVAGSMSDALARFIEQARHSL